MPNFDYLGFGLGLRPDHYVDVLKSKPAVDWFEIVSEDYLSLAGKRMYYLDKIREDYPIVMHGVSLSIGGIDPIDWDYLKRLKNLINVVQPAWVSDHLCWTGVNGNNLHDLMPVPYTEGALRHIVERIKQVQDYLGHPMLFENPSSYVTFKESTISEWEFLTRMVEESGCKLLFDVNNIYVSAFNHDYSAQDYIQGTPVGPVQQIHLAGHTNHGTHIVDTHDHDVIDEVWDLYRLALQRFGKVSTMIERDDDIPPLAELVQELQRARAIAAEVFAEEEVCA